MKKIYKIFLLVLTLVFLTTYNPNQAEISSKNNNTFFIINKIIILNNSRVSKDEIDSKLRQIYGKNIFFIKRKNLKESLKNINFLKKVEIKKKYPDTIIVKVFETKPVGIIYKDKTQYLIDSSSSLIKIENKNDYGELPNIIGDEADKNIINFIENLKSNKFPIKYIKNFYYFKIGRWDLELSDNRIIKLPYKIDNKIINKTIELLNRKDFQNYKIIDLRINGKIIVE